MAVQQARAGGSSRRASFGDKQQLSQRVAAYVREGIMVGQFEAGEFVRTEHLSEELGVSHTPIREALMILHSEGSLRWEPRRGYRVVPITMQDVRDIFQVQGYMAGELAARAASLLSDEEIARLESVQAELREAHETNDPERVDKLNHEVHRTINRASASWRMSSLLNLTVNYVPLRYFGIIEGWSEASVDDHTAVLTAIRDRDPDGARKAMTDHIEHIGGLLVDYLYKQNIFS